MLSGELASDPEEPGRNIWYDEWASRSWTIQFSSVVTSLPTMVCALIVDQPAILLVPNLRSFQVVGIFGGAVLTIQAAALEVGVDPADGVFHFLLCGHGIDLPGRGGRGEEISL